MKVTYLSKICSADTFLIDAYSTWTASSRGVCLVKAIGSPSKFVTPYESSGTSYSKFKIVDTPGEKYKWALKE